MNKKEIIDAFDEHLNKSGKKYYNDFYVGITNDIERRLFLEHKVPKENHWYIYAEADDDSIAREVEKEYIERGMRGNVGGGDNTSTYVYCYTVSPFTIESYASDK